MQPVSLQKADTEDTTRTSQDRNAWCTATHQPAVITCAQYSTVQHARRASAGAMSILHRRVGTRTAPHCMRADMRGDEASRSPLNPLHQQHTTGPAAGSCNRSSWKLAALKMASFKHLKKWHKVAQPARVPAACVFTCRPARATPGRPAEQLWRPNLL